MSSVGQISERQGDLMKHGLQFSLTVSAVATMALTGCGTDTGTSAISTEPQPSASADCSKDALPTIQPGTLTVATDAPAYSPYFEDDDPANGRGFESALTYAVAGKLGFASGDVSWVRVPFNKALSAGEKSFDFDINQVSITAKRMESVNFSKGYYDVNQAVVALRDSDLAGATSIADLKQAELGAQQGSTSSTFIKEVIRPTKNAVAFTDTVQAQAALEAKQVDGIVVDLPTAFTVADAELDNVIIVGQFEPQGKSEEFGLVLGKGSPIRECVNQAITELKQTGELKRIQDLWLSGESAPILTP